MGLGTKHCGSVGFGPQSCNQKPDCLKASTRLCHGCSGGIVLPFGIGVCRPLLLFTFFSREVPFEGDLGVDI